VSSLNALNALPSSRGLLPCHPTPTSNDATLRESSRSQSTDRPGRNHRSRDDERRDRNHRRERSRDRDHDKDRERLAEQRRKERDCRQEEGKSKRRGVDADTRNGSRNQYSPRTPVERSWRPDDAGCRAYRGYRGGRDHDHCQPRGQPYRGGDAYTRDGRHRDARGRAMHGASDRGRDHLDAPRRSERSDRRGVGLRHNRDGSNRHAVEERDNNEGEQLLAKYEEMVTAEEREVHVCLFSLCVSYSACGN
jgi:translation initiation factor 3 subunit A